MVMASFVKAASSVIKKFHADVDGRARKIGLGIVGLHALKQQLTNYENVLGDVSREAAETINNNQKEINREFVPVVQTAMNEAYVRALNETGPGCFVSVLHIDWLAYRVPYIPIEHGHLVGKTCTNLCLETETHESRNDHPRRPKTPLHVPSQRRQRPATPQEVDQRRREQDE